MIPVKSFWIRNITKQAISINDLGLYLMPYQFVNLLDHKAYPYLTTETIKHSLTDGILGKLTNKVVVCKVPPYESLTLKTSTSIDVDLTATPPTKIRSLFEEKEEYYEELQLSDEDYANENAETIDEFEKYKKV